jgi:hypothetical protein
MAGYAWWAAIALYVAWYIAMVPPVNRPLPSFRALSGEVREELEAIYPLDFYPSTTQIFTQIYSYTYVDGGFAHLPFGETRYYLMGPEKGRRVRTRLSSEHGLTYLDCPCARHWAAVRHLQPTGAEIGQKWIPRASLRPVWVRT